MPGYVQSVADSTAFGTSHPTPTMTAFTSGNAAIVITIATQNISSVTDDQSGTYAEMASFSLDKVIKFFYRMNITDGPTVITATSDSNDIVNIAAWEISDLGTGNPLQQSDSDDQLNVTAISGSVTTTNASEFAVGGLTVSDSATLSVSGDFDSEEEPAADPAFETFGYKANVGAAGSKTFTFDIDVAKDASMAVVTLFDSSGGAGGSFVPQHPMLRYRKVRR